MQFLIEAVEVRVPKVRWNSNIIIIFQWFLSMAVSLMLLLTYKRYASENGIILEKGCEGPGLPFGMLSGILFLMQLKFSLLSDKHKE